MNSTSTPDAAINSGDKPQLLSPGSVLQNRYRIVRQLGTGGMGAVYEAIDQRLDAVVALKETFSADERLRRQFEQEARLLAQLHHPSLPRVSDYFTEDGRAFLVMQFISGADLAQIIFQQPGPFPRNQVIAWADQLLDALIYLHTRDRQIIHRDIKPHNLKLTASGQIALLDFGLAKTHTADHSTTNSSNSIFGYTRRYSPLEQIQDLGTTPQSDIYALGATLYHLLTGVKPPDSLARAAALANSRSDPLRPASEIHAAVGTEIAAILCKAMALNANDRYESANEFREALRRVGRNEIEAANHANSRGGPLNDATANITVLRKPGTANLDPFDSYSILKPEEEVFRIAKRRRGPGVFAATFAVALVVVAVAYPGRLFDSLGGMLESAHITPSREASSTAVVHQSKPDASLAKPLALKNPSIASSGEINRKNDLPKRRVSRQDNARVRSLKPPPFSIAP